MLLKEILPATSRDEAVFRHAKGEERIIVSCNRGHFLALAESAIRSGARFAGLIILIRRRSRHSECAHLLMLLRAGGEIGLSGNINYA